MVEMQGLIVLRGIKIGHVANVDYTDKTNYKKSYKLLIHVII